MIERPPLDSSLQMLRVIGAYRVRMWLRRLRSRGGMGAAGSGLAGFGFVGLGVAIFFIALAITKAVDRANPANDSALLLIPFSLLLATTLLSGISVALNELFVASDIELLLTAPVSNLTLFLLKLFDTAMPVWPGIGWAMCALAGFGAALGLGAGFYLVALLATVLLGACTVAFDAGVVLIAARVVPPRRLREAVLLLTSLLGVGAWIFINAGSQRRALSSGSFNRFSGVEGVLSHTPLGAAAAAASAAADGRWWAVLGDLALLLVLAAALGYVGFVLFDRVFLPGWGAAREVTSHRRRRVHSASTPGKSPGFAIAAKEWRTVVRDIPYLSSLLPSVIYAVLFPVFLLRIPSGGSVAGRWASIAGAGIVPLLLSPTPSLTAIGREGASFEALRSSPLRGRDLFAGKAVAVALPVTVLAALAGVLLAVVKQAPPGALPVVVAGGIWLGAGCAIAGVSIGAIHPNFEPPKGRRRVSLNSAGCMLFVVVAGAFVAGTLALIAAVVAAVLRDSAPLGQRLAIVGGAAAVFALGLALLGVVTAVGLARAHSLLGPQD